MKYFVISDIHAHFSALENALQKAGFDPINPTHHLLVLGDLFDRGQDSVQVLEYMYDLTQKKKATIILGNHDSYLRDFLQKNYQKAYFNILHNGFGETLYSLSNIDVDIDQFDTIRTTIEARYPYLLSWISSFPLYTEIGPYIFVHGGIDGRLDNWKTDMSEHDFMWKREINMEIIPGKTVVAGHHRVATIRAQNVDYDELFMTNPELFDILEVEGKILIDRFVEVTNELNVLIVEL